MKLLQPNPGECVDRQTILEIKLEHAESIKLKDGTGAVNGTHWIDEHRAIQKYLETNWFLLMPKTLSTPFNELMAQLKAVNKKLWNCWEAASSINTVVHVPEGSKSSEQILFAYNHHRANLVSQINKLFGIVTQEKLYEATHDIALQKSGNG